MMNPVTLRRALISVSDKTAVLELAQTLIRHQVAILSTGGTAEYLKSHGVALTDVSDFTGFPEIMDGRVKTLQPKIHGGILAKRADVTHQQAMQTHGIEPIDLVVVNLYPFEQTVAAGVAADAIIEQIDIGGPAMIRAAAKNYADVLVLVDPADYAAIVTELDANQGAVSGLIRQRMAAKAFARTASYDSAITRWFSSQFTDQSAESYWPDYWLDASRAAVLRYGENPHQQAALYRRFQVGASVVSSQQRQGKELSYNNIHDTDAAWKLVNEWREPAVAIIKHANPSGVAVAASVAQAFKQALACDPTSAFGGILATNQPVTAELIEAIGSLFLEVIIAPHITDDAQAMLLAKKNLRLLITGGVMSAASDDWVIKSVSGGYVLQQANTITLDESMLRCVSKRTPTDAEMQDLRFAFAVCKHVKSNAIVIAKSNATIGIGAGQMSRVDSVRLACWKAEEAGLETKGCVLASDAFFPFDDNVHRAAEAGITALIHPGGSIRDEEVIAAADQYGMAMLMTGIRHFNH